MTTHYARILRNVAFCLLAVPLVLCGGSVPGALVVVEGARNVRYDGESSVSYEVSEVHPATDTLEQISSTLSNNGWRPLEEDVFNPGLKSSHVRGWTAFWDATVDPQVYVDQWLAQWEDDAGNIAFYTLQYRSPSADPAERSQILEVSAAGIPAGIAKTFFTGQ